MSRNFLSSQRPKAQNSTIYTTQDLQHYKKNQRVKMHRAKEIDITNENSNEEHTDQFGLSLMNKRSETKFPKPLRTEIFPSLCLLFNQSRKKSIEQILVNVETNEFEKQVRKFIVWM